MPRLELWGGPECTINRTGDMYHDQFALSGHEDRLDDLTLFAGLGIAALRYPILWERIAPERPDIRDWRWADARLARLRALNVRPIVGLVHHGSGPRYTNLLEESFAPGLAAHARAVAERYPWIDAWTPVNEPVTTARFSALYGLWHPHHRDERSFWLALLNQIDAVRLAMAEVRQVNPAAQLIQTDDLGRTYATAAVRDQAAFDNVRRWMGWDLLCGHVVPGHCLWQRLCGYGFEDRLRRIADMPCPPNVVGVNHYLTSDRFLDHRCRRYPEHLWGTNGERRYADTEAVRVLDPPPPGLRGVLREAWARYRLPLAITEVHNGSTREEQMRWMADAWSAAVELRQEGVDLRAVTSWALLGSCGWNTLLTGGGTYETGVFDVSDGTPRPTAMVGLLRALSRGGDLPAISTDAGWWKRPIRMHHPSVSRPAPMHDRLGRARPSAAPPLLIVGPDEEDAGEIAGACVHRALPFIHVRADDAALLDVLDRYQPWGAVLVGGGADAAWLRIVERRPACPAVSGCGEPVDTLLDRLIDLSAGVTEPLAA